MNEHIRASEVVKGMVIKLTRCGYEVEFTVSFARKHRRYSGHMMLQGSSKEHGFAELSPRCSDILERVTVGTGRLLAHDTARNSNGESI